MKTQLRQSSKMVLLLVVLVYFQTVRGLAQVNINLDNPKLYYDGVLYPLITSHSVTFNRHTEAAYADPSSGLVYAPCNLTRATQSGISIRFKTASATIKLSFAAQTTPEGYFYNNANTPPAGGFTVSVAGSILTTFTNTLSFTINHPNPGTPTTFEVSLPTLWSVQFTGMQLENGESLLDAGNNTKPKYAAFGTSISMGTGQNNSTQTYPYQVAQAKNWHLYNFAVAGSPLGWQLAYDIKGKQFDIISIEQGFNDWASPYISASLTEELALYGRFVDSLRKFQPSAKIYCITPITTTYMNATPRYSLEDFRSGICDLVAVRKTAGDNNIFCINGASISDGSMTGDGIHLSVDGAAKFASALAPLMTSAGSNKGYIPANDSYFQYTGRIDFTNPKKPTFSYPGVSIKANFQGPSLKVLLKDYGTGTASTTNYYNVIVDGGAPTVLQVNNTDTIYSISSSLTDTDHTLEIFKRTESSVGKSEFRGLILATGKALLSPPDRPAIRFEFIGDSYTCGYGNEVNIPQHGNPNTGFHSVNENNYNAWGAIATRALKAAYVCTAASGRGLYRNNTGATAGTIPRVYDQIITDQNNPAWEHHNYIPNVVVIHLGTNDFFPTTAYDSNTFVSTYINFINKIRGYYPSACIICAVPNGLSDYYPEGKNNLTHAKNYLKEIVEFVNLKGDKKVYNFVMRQQGLSGEPYGEDYHPSLQTQQMMADDLVTFVNGLTDCSSGATTEKTPAISLNNIIKTEGDAPFLLNASSTSQGEINYSLLSGNAVSVSPAGQVSILGPGVVMVKITQAAANGFKSASASTKITILSKSGKDTLAFTNNLAAGNDGTWSTSVDQLGSKVNSFSQTGPIDANFDQTPKTGNNWPWIALTKNVGKTLTDMTYLQVRYKSTVPVQIALPQAPLSTSGENFNTVLNASHTFTTVLIPITAFAKPSWSTSTVALDLSKITSINFIPLVSDPTIGGTANLEITSLVLYKTALVSSVIENDTQHHIQLISISDSGLLIQIPSTGEYQVQLLRIDGKELMNIHQTLYQGQQMIYFDKLPLNDQLVLFHISNNHDLLEVFKLKLKP